MKYRPFKESDFESIKFLCEKNEIALPHLNSFVIVAENDEGQIVGLGGYVQLAFFEPLISDNPVVANNLYQQITGVAMGQGSKELFLYCDSDKRELYEKAGFELLEDKKIIMKKKL